MRISYSQIYIFVYKVILCRPCLFSNQSGLTEWYKKSIKKHFSDFFLEIKTAVSAKKIFKVAMLAKFLYAIILFLEPWSDQSKEHLKFDQLENVTWKKILATGIPKSERSPNHSSLSLSITRSVKLKSKRSERWKPDAIDDLVKTYFPCSFETNKDWILFQYLLWK